MNIGNKKIKKIIAVFVLCSFLQSTYAFFVTDMLSIFNNAMVEIQNAAQRISESFQWAQEIKSMEDAWNQIQTYYKEIKSLPADAIHMYKELTDGLDRISQQFDELNNSIVAMTDETKKEVENLNKTEIDIQNAQLKDEEEMNKKLFENPIMSKEELKQSNKERISYLEGLLTERKNLYHTLDNKIQTQKDFIKEQRKKLKKAEDDTKKLSEQIDKEAGSLTDKLLSDEISQKQIEIKQLYITSLSFQWNNMKEKLEKFSNALDEQEKILEEMENTAEKWKDDCESIEDELKQLKKENEELK